MGRSPWRAAVVLLCVIGVRPAGAVDERAWFDGMEARPYRVSIRVAFGDHPRLTATVRERALEQLRAASRATLGAAWQVEVLRDDVLPVSTAADLERLEPEDVPIDRGAESPWDKVFVVTVDVDSTGLAVVAAREFDPTVQSLGRVAEERTGRWSELGRTLFVAVHGAYRPLALVTEIDATRLRIRPLASEFTPPDESAAAVRPGALLVPFLRYLDKEGNVGGRQTIPWTYIRVDAIEGTTATATTISGLQSSMGTSIRRRVQVVGLLVRPRFEATQLTVAPRTSPGTPLAGVRVRAIRKMLAREEGVGEPLEMTTNRRGHARVPRDDAHPLTWLYVHSGDELLARVPLAVGVEAEVPFLVPDDEPRLLVEGRIEILQADMIDTVAARETMLRRIKILARDGEWKQVDPLLEELRKLPTAIEFEQRLATIHAPALGRARAARNARAVHGIGKLVERTRDRIRRYLDPQRVNELTDELDELRKLDTGDGDGLE